MDWLTVGWLTIVMCSAVGVHFLIKQGKFRLEMVPKTFGIGAAVCMFLISMTASMLQESVSKFSDYIFGSLFWSLLIGVIGYISGRILVNRIHKGK
jgi:hypothetical protein